MQELFENVRDEVKKNAELAWKLAMMQHTPIQAAELLNNVTNYYKNIYTNEEVEFLQFYFNMQLEMMKK